MEKKGDKDDTALDGGENAKARDGIGTRMHVTVVNWHELESMEVLIGTLVVFHK